MNRRSLSLSLVSVFACVTLAGCSDDLGTTADASRSSLPAAQSVVVAPAASSAAVLESDDVVFEATTESAPEMAAEALPALKIVPMAFQDLLFDEKGITTKATVAPSGYSPTQIRHAYGIDTLPNQGDGQTIVIVDAYGSPTARADLAYFSQATALPAATLTIAYQNNVTPKTDAGWAMETSLDVQWAHAVAPKAKILLVVAKSSSLSDLLACVDYATAHGATQVSMSWGSPEFSSQSAFESHFSKTGVTYLASSGDSGAGQSWPAASPHVTSVGGTSLKLTAANTVSLESAWSGSGGGRSAYFVAPAYQTAKAQVSAVCNGKRGGPDVSYNADPATGYMVYDTTPYQGRSGWVQLGGTSASAPQWAGLTSIVNSKRVSSSLATVGAWNTALYAAPIGSFRDVVLGSNGNSAGSGYDLVTGLGSPMTSVLFQSTSK